MKNLTTSFARAAMLLLLAVFTTTTARATDYITDVIVLGHKTSEGIAELCASYQNQGYTIILSELNSGLNTKPCIYLGYKATSNPTSGDVITDFYIRGASSNVNNSTLTYNGHTYHLAQFAGDSGFNDKNGDLNYGAGGDYIHLFYTKQHFDDWRLVTGITINETQSGAVGQNGGTTGYNLNNGCSGGNAIYMHITTARGPIFLQDATSNFTVINGDVLTGTLGGNYKVSIADGATVTLRNATINGVNDSNCQWAGITCEGNATIVLASGTTNTVKGFYRLYPGIYVPKDKTLTIKGSGSLTASSNGDGAGIGGAFYPEFNGNIVIEGGTITATGGYYAAGIGSGRGCQCGNITISGGTITANGGECAPGIGGGCQNSCGIITISGGTVTATGGNFSAGIGTGDQGTCDVININGGTVTATGGKYSAGIGTGGQGTCGNISITTGVTSVTATKGQSSPNSIGAGRNGTCGTVTIGSKETGNISQSPFVTYPYTVTFISNGGAGTMANQILMYNVPQNLSNNTFTYTNRAFSVWNTQANGSGTAYANQQNVSNLASTSGATVTLYAQWQSNSLTDGTAYRTTQDGSVSTATYTRTIEESRVGKHQAWFVPFDYTITSTDESKFSFYKINMIANSPTPSQGATDEMWVFLKPISAGTVLHANMPYVFKPKEEIGSYTFTTTNATLKAKNTEVLAKMETMEDIYEIYGIYQNTSPSASNPFYYININGEISLGNSNSVTVGPYRWIIRKTSKYGNNTSYAPAMRFFDGEEDDDPTIITEVTERTEDAEAWYDLNGRRLSGEPTQKGIYIHNGRKEAIR